MKVSCPSCQTNYNIDDKRIPPGGAKLKCARCQNTFPIKAGEPAPATPAAIPLPGATMPASAAIPLPGPVVSAAIPLPGPSFQKPAYEDVETTRVMAIPVPTEAYRDNRPPPASAGAIPLPGAVAPTARSSMSDDFDIAEAPVSATPSAFAGEAIPLPGAAPADPYASFSNAIPLPGATSSHSEDLTPAYDYSVSAPPGDAIALPPPAANPYASDSYASGTYTSEAYAAADAYDSEASAAASPDDAIALPPPTAADPYASAPEPGDGFALPPASEDPYATSDSGDPFSAAPESNDAFALPPPAAADAYASSGTEEDPFALPPPPAALVDEDPFALPPAMGEPLQDFSSGSGDEDPFALPAMGEPLQDFSDAPTARPSTVDVGMDFSEPPQAMPMAASGLDDLPPASIPDALEFDPSAPASARTDDLEADLSAPLPPMTTPGTADGLEMLSFIDDAAKGSAKPKATGRRFQVRRRSGKVFGPFEEGVVVKMLEDGQLLGNEDVSSDGEAWVPIGTVAAFATAIQKLMEGPGTPASGSTPPVAASEPGAPIATPASSAANIERLNQLYGGRMAQVSVVDNTSKLEVFMGKVKKRIRLVASIAAAVVFIGVGLGFGATRYGVFGFKKFFPAHVKAGTPEANDVEAARKALLQDSFQSYKQASTLTAGVLAHDEYPEVRAIWCQSVAYLQRRYSAATGDDLRNCHSEEMHEQLELLGDKNVEYIKYAAGDALAAREPDKALQLLEDAWSRETNHQDVELALLLAEAQAVKAQNTKAIETLKGVLQKQPELAKAQHALGNLYQTDNKADEAAQAYEAALKADPTHLISAVELAAVQLLLRKDAQKGLEATERALDEKLQAQMGPSELARAHSLQGIALFQLFKLPEAEKELRGALEKTPDSILVKRYMANVLYAQHRYQDALPFFAAVTQAEPKNIEAMDGYITSMATLGKMEDAQKLVKEANQRFPNNAHIEYLHGRIDEARDSTNSAVEHYTSAIKADPKLIDAQVSLGRLQLRLHHTELAKIQLEQAATQAPDDATVHSGLGELALVEEDSARAQQEFTRAIQLDPNLALAHLGLSRLALANGDLQTADKESQRALELDPNTLKGGRLQRGSVLLRLGKLDEATEQLKQAQKEEPRSVGIATMLGAAYIDKGSAAMQAKKDTEANGFFKEAEVNLMIALKSEPSNAEANFYMAQGRAKRGEFSQAIENMRTAVEHAPKRPDYHLAMGNIYREAKQPSDALAEWQTAVTLDPKNLAAFEAIGQLHLERNELDDAIASFQAVLKVDPGRSEAVAAIGDAHFSATRWRDAVKSYEQALKLDPSLTTLYYKMGRAWSEQAQYAKAIDWYLKASTATPNIADTWSYLGYAYKEKGKKKDAVKSFQEYLTRKPDAQDRKEIEEEISFLQ